MTKLIVKGTIRMIKPLVDAILELNEKKAIELTRYHLNAGIPPIRIIEDIQTGMIQIGDLYHGEKYYLGDLIMAGIIFKEILDLEEMIITACEQITAEEKKPTILIGTVKDDLHDIGKDLFSGMASASGFTVIDLGVDVFPEVFLNNYYSYKPEIIAISGILTQSIQMMKTVVDLFIKSGQRKDVKIIVGGYPLTKEACAYIGADAFGMDIKEGLEICNQWIKESTEVNI